MDLVSLYTVELMKSVYTRNTEIKIINELEQDHIVKNEIEEYVDFESFSESEKIMYEVSNKMRWLATLKVQLLKEYIRENSGMEFDNVFLISTEELIQKVKNVILSEEFLYNYILLLNKMHVIEVFGNKDANIFEGKTPLEIKELYFSMMTQSMIKNGYTQEQIDECVKKLACKMGGKEKTSSLNK